MIGGAGHMMDMNRRMEQNRSMKRFDRKKLRESKKKEKFDSGIKLEFKEVSKEELEIIKLKIRQNAKKEKRREKIILTVSTVIVVVGIPLLIYYFNN